MDSLKSIKHVLVCFQLLSGLKIKFSKSKLFSLGAGAKLLNLGVSILSCEIGEWPFSYLGVTIGLSPKKILFWEPLLNKVDSRLASWRCSNLNMAGRAVLLKAFIDSLPSYRFNIFTIPIGVCQKLGAIRRSFIWGGGEFRENGFRAKKLHLIN